jgi:hypothetical protein
VFSIPAIEQDSGKKKTGGEEASVKLSKSSKTRDRRGQCYPGGIDRLP